MSALNFHAVKAIYKFEMARTGRTLLQSVVSPVVSTSLYFVVFGSAIGSRISEVGGVSYGALGMSHQSVQDIAVARAIPGLAVLLPADRHETRRMTEALAAHVGGAYIRIGRNPVEDVYESDDYPFEIGKAVTMREGRDLTIIATGETVRVALDAHAALLEAGVRSRVLNMHTIKPLDEAAILRAARETGRIITVEEHSIHGGLGAAVAETIVQHAPVPMRILGIPDEPAIAGKTAEVFAHYGITSAHIKDNALELLSK